MARKKPAVFSLNDQFTFFYEFLKHPLQIGSIIPSSRFLEQRILKTAGIATSKTIVELGCGTGGTTRAILKAMPRTARLLSIDINPHFHALVSSRIDDERFVTHLGNSRELKKIISLYGLGDPDVIISGIPFSTMNRCTGSQLLAEISSLLAPNGRFVAYQVSKRVVSLCRPFFGYERTQLELLNIPPMFIFRWDKPAFKVIH